MATEDGQLFQQCWLHLMEPFDAILEDARRNAATLPTPGVEIDELLRRAQDQRAAAEEALRAFLARRDTLAATLDEAQRALAIAGVPLRGEIS